MKVILIEDVKGKGKKGDIIDVAQGYGQNFLISKSKAVLATDKEIERLNNEKLNNDIKRKQEIEESKKLAEKIVSYNFVFKVKSNEGRLFGTFSKKEISKNIELTSGIKLNTNKLSLNIDKIQSIGTFEINYEVTKGVIAKFKIKLVEM